MRFKLRLACNPDLRVQEVDLVRDQRKRKFGGDGASRESILSQELALMAEEEADEREDDARLAVSLGPDQGIQEALRQRAADEAKKMEASALDKTQYNDADDDASEFDASQMDDTNSQYTYATGFSQSRAGGRMGKSRRQPRALRDDYSDATSADLNPARAPFAGYSQPGVPRDRQGSNRSRFTAKSGIIRRGTVTSEVVDAPGAFRPG